MTDPRRATNADAEIDHGPEWSLFDEADRKRVGPARTERRHDRGLGTEISYTEGLEDGQLRRMRSHHGRAKFDSKKAKNEKDALAMIQRVCSQLDAPDSVIDRACVVFRAAHREGVARGRSLEGVVGAAVLVACRDQSVPTTATQVATHLPDAIDRTTIHRTLDEVETAADAHTLPPQLPALVPRIASHLDLTREERDRAAGLAREAVESGYATGGKKPAGVAAAAIYLAADELTQEEIADAAGTTATTLRTHAREIDGIRGDGGGERGVIEADGE